MVSIVIPMYNVERVILRTIKSILEQEIDNMEILLVDDCSTDSTYSICKKYIADNKISNISVIKNEKNAGPSYTRNRGMKIAKGNYLVMLDADDYYEKNTIKKMLETMQGKSLVITGIKYKKNNNEKIITNNMIQCNEEIQKNKIVKIYLEGLLNQPSNKMYDLQLIKENNIEFNENSKYGEDLEFNLKYLQYVEKIFMINEPLYVYHETKSGLNSTYKSDELEIDRKNFEYRLERFEEYCSISESEKKELYTRYIRDRARLYYRYEKYDKRHNKKEFMNEQIEKDDFNKILNESNFNNKQQRIIKQLTKKKMFFILRIYMKLAK